MDAVHLKRTSCVDYVQLLYGGRMYAVQLNRLKKKEQHAKHAALSTLNVYGSLIYSCSGAGGMTASSASLTVRLIVLLAVKPLLPLIVSETK